MDERKELALVKAQRRLDYFQLHTWDNKEQVTQLVNKLSERLKELKVNWEQRAEFVIWLNWMIRRTTEIWHNEIATTRDDLRQKMHDYCCDTLKDDDLTIYLHTVD